MIVPFQIALPRKLLPATRTPQRPRLLRGLLALWLLVPCPASGAEPGHTYFGLCDASAAVGLDADLFVVADDEDNILRVYSRREGDAPVHSLDLTRFLRVDRKSPEADIEGAARVGDLIYWITSHGRNRNGRECPSRQRFFAITGSVNNGAVALRPVGEPYTRLLHDLVSDPRLRRFNLAAAARLAPKAPGALNIEGLTAMPDGALLLGFRSPIPEGRALLVPLLNPSEVIAGIPARLGEPTLLALDGRGVRSITAWRGRYLIIAGSHDAEGTSDLYVWGGAADAPERLGSDGFAGLNPEGLAEFPGEDTDDLLMVSDDGDLLVGKRPCKKLKVPMQKRFRATQLGPEVLPPAGTRTAIR